MRSCRAPCVAAKHVCAAWVWCAGVVQREVGEVAFTDEQEVRTHVRGQGDPCVYLASSIALPPQTATSLVRVVAVVVVHVPYRR